MAYDLTGRSVLITGAARGIGAESARRLAQRGARLSLVGLEPGELERVAADCPGAIWSECDVTDRDAIGAAVGDTVERLGGIDVCMANAGIATAGLVRHMDPAAIERTLEVNLMGVVRTLQAVMPHVVARQGYLLPIASMAALAHAPGMAAYAASKAGVEAYADALRGELRHTGTRVGVAYFSWIDTEMVRGADRHDFAGHLRASLTGPFARTYPVSAAADAVVRGIERRARWVCAPGWIRALILARGLVQPLADHQAGRDVPQAERIFLEQLARDGAEASAAVGAGGAADPVTHSAA